MQQPKVSVVIYGKVSDVLREGKLQKGLEKIQGDVGMVLVWAIHPVGKLL